MAQLKIVYAGDFAGRDIFYQGGTGWARNDFNHLDMFINIRHNCTFQENSKKSFLIISVYLIFGFNQPAQMLCNIIFPTAKNLSIRSRCVFYFMFSLKFKAFVMFLTFLLFQSNLYIVLAHRRS